MLIICNGTFKSGSTWLHLIVVELLKICNIEIDSVPAEYTNNLNSPTTIIESKLNQFLKYEDCLTNNYITKSHYLRKATLIQKYTDSVRFLFITRDPKDAIVSHYYHIKNKYNISISFNLYYYLLGRYKGYEICKLNYLYKQSFEAKQFIDFEMLRTNFQDTVDILCGLLGVRKLDNTEMLTLQHETSIDTLRKKIKNGEVKYYSTVKKNKWKLIRGGAIGDWKSYFSENNIRDFYHIELLNVSFLSKLIYFFLFTFRRLIFSIE